MKFLAAYRKKYDLSKYEMARRTGISQQTYSHLERKAKGLELKNLVKIKNGLGLTWDQLGKLIEENLEE